MPKIQVQAVFWFYEALAAWFVKGVCWPAASYEGDCERFVDIGQTGQHSPRLTATDNGANG